VWTAPAAPADTAPSGMKTRRTMGRIASTLLLIACFTLTCAAAYAQSPAPDEGGTDIFSNMPGAVILLIPILIGGALYISRRLGPRDDERASTRREGAVSRTLARSKRT
jgi:hypothetical protein